MISESTETKTMGRDFGLHRAMDSSGTVLGSALAYILWSEGFDIRLILLTTGIMAIASRLPFYKVKESYRPIESGLGSGSGPISTLNPSLSNISPDLKRFISIASLISLGNFSNMFFILRVRQFYTGSLEVGAPLLLYTLFNVVYALLTFPVGVWSDKIGRKRVLTTGYVLFALTCAGLVMVGSTPPLDLGSPLLPLRPDLCHGKRL